MHDSDFTLFIELISTYGRRKIETEFDSESVDLRKTVDSMEAFIIRFALYFCDFNISMAARNLSLKRTTLMAKMTRLGISIGNTKDFCIRYLSKYVYSGDRLK